MSQVGRHRFARLGPNLVLIGAAIFFIAPILSTARQALQKVPMPLFTWGTLFDKWSLAGLTAVFDEDLFWPALWLTLKLAIATVLITLTLLVPTALYVHLRLPRARPLVEFLTVLPYVVPPIALAAGVAAFYRANARWLFSSQWALVPFYVIMALPFTYRSIDAGLNAIDVRTLVDASRNLGAGWLTTLRRVLLPNLASSILSASFLTTTVVLGEFTIAVTLNKQTFPVFSFQYFGRNPQGGIALALLTLLGTTALLAVLSLLTRTKAQRAARQKIRMAAAPLPIP
ncbi:MAG TPA: ABC transporter permease subunit [Ilumatobacter sp.]|nr:ABC transporter permease subunit [Ilumatobacter sp.]